MQATARINAVCRMRPQAVEIYTDRLLRAGLISGYRAEATGPNIHIFFMIYRGRQSSWHLDLFPVQGLRAW